MMYVVQAATGLGVLWACYHYQLFSDGHGLGIVTVLAMLLVTAIFIEARLLPARIARMKARIFGLKNEAADEIPSLPPTRGHARNSLEDWTRLRISQDPR